MPARVKACGHKEHCGEQPGVPQQPAHLALLRHQRQGGLPLGREHPLPTHLRQHNPHAAPQ